MTKDEILALAERVEQAAGPDRELDRDIADALGFGPPADWSRRPRLVGRVVNLDCGSWGSPGGGLIRDSACVTKSLDAAMTLVPEGYDWIIARTNGGLTIYAEVGGTGGDFTRFADTPAQALTAAALRAIAEGMEA